MVRLAEVAPDDMDGISLGTTSPFVVERCGTPWTRPETAGSSRGAIAALEGEGGPLTVTVADGSVVHR